MRLRRKRVFKLLLLITPIITNYSPSKLEMPMLICNEGLCAILLIYKLVQNKKKTIFLNFYAMNLPCIKNPYIESVTN